ncbi:hypothetical protein V5F34_11025 [Xanthobacter autotrophicus]|uniref:hypothetical protein n=1 Tax=Xanthobacter autotrophicus TaxID=280 RepID=UPI0037271D77
MRPDRLLIGRLLGRAGGATLWALLLLAAAALANLIGIRMAGDIEGWELWMKAHAAWLLGWRLLVYGATVAGWIRMRRRLREREPDGTAHGRLLRVEIAAVAAFIALEASLLLGSA